LTNVALLEVAWKMVAADAVPATQRLGKCEFDDMDALLLVVRYYQYGLHDILPCFPVPMVVDGEKNTVLLYSSSVSINRERSRKTYRSGQTKFEANSLARVPVRGAAPRWRSRRVQIRPRDRKRAWGGTIQKYSGSPPSGSETTIPVCLIEVPHPHSRRIPFSRRISSPPVRGIGRMEIPVRRAVSEFS
jgi:hypothetical protein